MAGGCGGRRGTDRGDRARPRRFCGARPSGRAGRPGRDRGVHGNGSQRRQRSRRLPLRTERARGGGAARAPAVAAGPGRTGRGAGAPAPPARRAPRRFGHGALRTRPGPRAQAGLERHRAPLRGRRAAGPPRAALPRRVGGGARPRGLAGFGARRHRRRVVRLRSGPQRGEPGPGRRRVARRREGRLGAVGGRGRSRGGGRRLRPRTLEPGRGLRLRRLERAGGLAVGALAVLGLRQRGPAAAGGGVAKAAGIGLVARARSLRRPLGRAGGARLGGAADPRLRRPRLAGERPRALPGRPLRPLAAAGHPQEPPAGGAGPRLLRRRGAGRPADGPPRPGRALERRRRSRLREGAPGLECGAGFRAAGPPLVRGRGVVGARPRSRPAPARRLPRGGGAAGRLGRLACGRLGVRPGRAAARRGAHVGCVLRARGPAPAGAAPDAELGGLARFGGLPVRPREPARRGFGAGGVRRAPLGLRAGRAGRRGGHRNLGAAAPAPRGGGSPRPSP